MSALRNRRLGTHAAVAARRPAASAIACGAELITRRAVAPFWRASMNDPSMVIVRVTFIAAGSRTSTSRTVVVTPKFGGNATAAPGRRPASGRAKPPPEEITIRRPPRSRSCAP